jgi:hypothetical protein
VLLLYQAAVREIGLLRRRPGCTLGEAAALRTIRADADRRSIGRCPPLPVVTIVVWRNEWKERVSAGRALARPTSGLSDGVLWCSMRLFGCS